MNRYRLTDICDFQGGSQPPKSQWKDTYKNGYIRMLQIRDFTQKAEKIEYVKETNSIKKCSEDDILIARYGASIGKILTGLEGAYNVAIVKTIPNSKILSKTYLYYYLNSSIFQKYIKNVGSRAAQAGFNKNELNKLEIDLPTLDKQKIIVENLQKIQNIISNKEYQIAALDNLIKSLFVEMFQSGNYPKDKLGKLCDVRDGTHDSPKYLKESKYKFITSKNITNNEIDFSDIKYISKQDYDNFNARSKVNNGDILMPMIGTIGNPIIVNIPDEKIDFAIKNVALIKFPTYSKVTNIYIKNLFDSDYFENAISHKKRGGTQKFIALSDIRTLKIEIPPIELQNKFAEFVNQIDKQKFEIQNSLNKMKALYETMMNKYFG